MTDWILSECSLSDVEWCMKIVKKSVGWRLCHLFFETSCKIDLNYWYCSVFSYFCALCLCVYMSLWKYFLHWKVLSMLFCQYANESHAVLVGREYYLILIFQCCSHLEFHQSSMPSTKLYCAYHIFGTTLLELGVLEIWICIIVQCNSCILNVPVLPL